MRFLVGIIVGVALTIGVAFIVDSQAAGTATTGSGSAVAEHRQMVNWDVAGDNVRMARDRIHSAWVRLSQKVAS